MNKNAKFLALTLSFMFLGLTCACSLGDKEGQQAAISEQEAAQIAAMEAEDADEADYETNDNDQDDEEEFAEEAARNVVKPKRQNNKAIGQYRATGHNKIAQSASLASRGFGQYQVYDQQAGMPMITFKVPRGWQATSEVKWVRFGYSLFTYEVRFSDPNSGIGISYFSGVSGARDGAMNSAEILNNPKKYGQSFVGGIKDYVRINGPVNLVSAELVPMSTDNNPLWAQIKAQGGNCLARQLVCKYDFKKNNQPWGAMVTANVFLQEMSFAYGPTSHVEWVLDLTSYIYPKSEAEPTIKLGKQIVASAVPNPQWQQYLANVTNGVVAQQNSQFQQQQQSIRQSQQDISDMLSDSYQQRSASQDRISQGWSEAIRGESSHTNPYDSSSTVNTSNNYNHGWANSNGNVINTDDSNFNPNTAPGYNGDWTQIK